MKTIRLIIEEAPLWIIFVVSTVFFTATPLGVILPFLNYYHTQVDWLLLIKITVSVGILFGLLVWLMVSTLRKSRIFWNTAKELDKKIDHANTKKELKDLFDNDFQELCKLSMGNPHYIELNRLHAIIETKHKFVK